MQYNWLHVLLGCALLLTVSAQPILNEQRKVRGFYLPLSVMASYGCRQLFVAHSATNGVRCLCRRTTRKSRHLLFKKCIQT